MNFGMNAVDLLGWFGLVAVLAGLFLLKRHGTGMTGLWLLLGALFGTLIAVLWFNDFRNTLLTLSMIVLGAALAPWFSGKRQGVLAGVALINAVWAWRLRCWGWWGCWRLTAPSIPGISA